MNARCGNLFLSTALAAGVYALGLAVGRQVLLLTRHATAAPSPAPAQATSGSRLAQSLTNDSVFTNLSPFLPETITALQMLIARVKEVDRAGQYEAHFETDELTPLLFALSADDYPLAWRVFRELKSADMRQYFLATLASIWAGKAPQPALAAVLTLPKGEEAQNALYGVLSVWAERDSTSALAWARTQPEGKQRDQAMAWIVQGLTGRDPKAAAALFLTLPASPETRGCGLAVLQSLAASDPEGATTVFKSLERYEREFALETLADARASRDPQAAIAWAQGLTNSKERQLALEDILRTWTETQPEQALQFAMAQADGTQRDKLVIAAVRAWANRDLAAASAWVAQLPASPLRDQVWRTPRTELHDETGANQALTLAPTEGLARAVDLERIGRIWSEQGENYQAVQQWASQLPAKDRDAVLAGICASLGGDFPEQAVRIAASITSDQAQERALQHAASTWAHSDPEAMAAWSTSLPQGAAREEVFRELAIGWSRSEPAAAAQWLCALPADDARAGAADLCVSMLAARPDLAIQCLGLVTDEKRRLERIEDIAQVWLKSDPEAAQAWLETTPLPADRKAKLLKR